MIEFAVFALTLLGVALLHRYSLIVAASNPGGSGSVVGDTTTTMMWIAGASALAVLAYLGGFGGFAVLLLVYGWHPSMLRLT